MAWICKHCGLPAKLFGYVKCTTLGHHFVEEEELNGDLATTTKTSPTPRYQD